MPELRIPIANVGLYHVLLDRRAALKKCVKIITIFELQMLYGTARHIADDSTKTSLLDVFSMLPGLRRYNSELHSGTLRRHPGNEIFQEKRANNLILRLT